MVERITASIMAKPKGRVQSQLDPSPVSDPTSDKPRPEHGYWLIPPEIWNPLNTEFEFDYDPCPNPRPEGYNGLEDDWGRANWVNPPFWAGITAWVRKCIAEAQNGKDVVLIVPLDNWVNLLLQAGAEVRPIGSHDWIHTKTGKRQKAPRPSILFILRGETITTVPERQEKV